MNHEREFNPEIQKDIIAEIAEALVSNEYKKVLMNESIGGNAGENQAAVNALVKKNTGEIVIFGNTQDVPQEIWNDPENTRVIFLNNFGDIAAKFQALPEEKKGHAFSAETITLVYSKSAELSDEAILNLRIAIGIVNKNLKNN